MTPLRWSILGGILVALLVLGLVFGPRLVGILIGGAVASGGAVLAARGVRRKTIARSRERGRRERLRVEDLERRRRDEAAKVKGESAAERLRRRTRTPGG